MTRAVHGHVHVNVYVDVHVNVNVDVDVDVAVNVIGFFILVAASPNQVDSWNPWLKKNSHEFHRFHKNTIR